MSEACGDCHHGWMRAGRVRGMENGNRERCSLAWHFLLPNKQMKEYVTPKEPDCLGCPSALPEGMNSQRKPRPSASFPCATPLPALLHPEASLTTVPRGHWYEPSTDTAGHRLISRGTPKPGPERKLVHAGVTSVKGVWGLSLPCPDYVFLYTLDQIRPLPTWRSLQGDLLIHQEFGYAAPIPTLNEKYKE